MYEKKFYVRIDSDLYNRILKFAQKKNLSFNEMLLKCFPDEFIDYSNLSRVKLEDTGVFNYVGGQCLAYNRFKENDIHDLSKLFELYDAKKINYGVDKRGYNYYIHNEISGIIVLLKYKYLGINSESLSGLLNFNVDSSYGFSVKSCAYPGEVFKKAMVFNHVENSSTLFVKEFYKTLKSCGFTQRGVKVIIDIAFANKIENMRLGEFLLNIDIGQIKTLFSRIPQEYSSFVETLNILVDYYKQNVKNEDAEIAKTKVKNFND